MINIELTVFLITNQSNAVVGSVKDLKKNTYKIHSKYKKYI